MTLIEQQGNRASVKQEAMSLTETDSSEAMPSWSQPLLNAKVSCVKATDTGKNRDALAQNLQVLKNVMKGENSRSDEFQGMKEERYRLLEENNSCGMENKELKKKLLEKEVARKGMTVSLLDLERSVIFLETKKCLLMRQTKSYFLALHRRILVAVDLRTSCCKIFCLCAWNLRSILRSNFAVQQKGSFAAGTVQFGDKTKL